MKQPLLASLAVLVLAGLVLALTACESPAAQREEAKAERIRAEAQAYERERAADTAAVAERAAVRQMERDAAHERTLETLPFVLAIGGGVLVLLAGVAAFLLVLRWLEQRQAQEPRREQPAAQLAPPMQVYYIIAPPGENRGRAAYWRQLEAAAHGGQVVEAIDR